MEVDAISRKGKGNGKFGKGKKGGKKGKESHSGKGHGETTVEHSRFESECRNCGKCENKAADCWCKQPPKPQGKGKGSGKSKSKVTEISENDSSKQVEETWTPNTCAPQSSLSQVNTIGCADEGLWIFSLEDDKKRRYTVNWEDPSCSNPTRGNDSGALLKDLNNLDNDAQIMPQQKENVSDYKQMRQNPNQQFEGSEDDDHVVDRKTRRKWYQEQQGNLPHTSSLTSSSWQNSSWKNWNSWWWHFL